jgi:hypothetical protein
LVVKLSVHGINCPEPDKLVARFAAHVCGLYKNRNSYGFTPSSMRARLV